MPHHKLLYRITAVFSLVMGIVFFLIFSETAPVHSMQYGLLGFLIGFPILWLVYFIIWFLSKGFKRTAFPIQSAHIISMVQKRLSLSLTPFQEKLAIEIAGALLMVSMALIVAGAGFVIVSGLLFLAGRLSW